MRSLHAVAALALVVLLSGCASTELVVLLPDESGKVGQLDVTSDGATVALDKALSAARAGGTSLEQATVSDAEVKASFGAALDAAPAAPKSFTLYFLTGSTRLAPGSQQALDDMLAEVRKRAAPDVQVTGHTDRVGRVEDNDRLALKRAERILAALLDSTELRAEMVRAVGRGEREPLVETADEVAEARNRRVEIIVR